MRVWTKQAESGKTVELRFQDSTISIRVDGECKGETGCVVELGDLNRGKGALYAQAPRKNGKGEAITHAVHTILLTGPEGKEVERLFAEEQAECKARQREQALAAVATQYEEARRTGKPVEVEMWVDTCNDCGCNCCATFHRMVKPDGTFTIHCHHSF